MARFGASLHVSGTDEAALEATVERLEAEGTHRWRLQAAGLEEAFIYLMAGARDNFARRYGARSMSGMSFSLQRFGAVLIKEFIQMRRDRVTFAMMIGLPIVQLMLFGFAINADPRHLPTLVEMADDGPLTRAILAGMQNSGYFDFRGPVAGAAAGEEALRRGDGEFRRRHPGRISSATSCAARSRTILIAADASDPSAAGGASSALQRHRRRSRSRETLTGPAAPGWPGRRRRSRSSCTASTTPRARPRPTSCRACSPSSCR